MSTGSVKGTTYTIKELFDRHFYKVDYYQREYAWSAEDVRTLIDDLIEAFRESWQEGRRKSHYSDPDKYFLALLFLWMSHGIDDFLLMANSDLRRFTLSLCISGALPRN